MTNDELKKKIVDIALHAEWTDMFGDHNSIGKYAANAIADALIAAGIGDVEESENKATAAELVAQVSASTAIEKIAEWKRRAEVAERAFDDLVEEIYQHDVRPICDKEFFMQARFEQAKKELAEVEE